MPTKLDLFLNGNKDGKTEQERRGRRVEEAGKPFSLWSFEGKDKWMINSDDMDEFYRLYYANLMNGVPMYFTERSTAVGMLRVDLDFKYVGIVDEHRHNHKQVIAFVKAYMAEVKRYLVVDDFTDVYILEKDNPTFDKTKGVSASGIHMQIPSLKSTSSVETSIRRNLLPRMEEFFPNLGLRDDWDKVYDKSALTHTGNWPLLGSKKQGDSALPYKIKYLVEWDPATGNIRVDDEVPPMPTIELIRKMTVRSSIDNATPLTEYGKENTKPAAEPTQTAPRGRSETRDGSRVNSRGSSPGRYKEPLSDARKKYIEAHAMNLKQERYTNYDEWVKVGLCLKNIHTDLEDVWLDFSKQIDLVNPNTFKASECLNKWMGFGSRVEGELIGEGSLRFWSREDNRDGYDEIEKNNVDKLVNDSAATATEYDVAMVVQAKYRDDFRCSSYINNDWYHYVDHIWKNSERGVELLRRLSSDISKLYLVKEQNEINILTTLEDCKHSKDVTPPDCSSCQAEKRKKQFSTLRMKLKTTAFKSNVMKECQVLMWDPEFAKKIDENKHLLAFNNGVYDTLTQTFREGRPDDYLSFCTKVDYNPDKMYTAYPCWSEIELFLRRILPNASVREYFVRHLATCLSGEFQPRFHIMTGTGSNGKSMVMNLMATAMGDYCYKVNVALFTQKRGKVGAAQPELMRMRGRRFVMMSEPDEGEPLSTGVLKELTSAEKITCRDLFAGSKHMVEFDVQAKFHLACNDKPTVNSNDGGTWRRLKVIHFPSKFMQTPDPKKANEYMVDESIQQKVISEEWATCFMAYLVHLYTEGKGLRNLVVPKEVDAYTSEYQEDSDVIAQFMRDYVHPVEEPLPEGTAWSAILATFNDWKRQNQFFRGSAGDLKKRIEASYTPIRGVGYNRFRFGAE